MLVDNKRPLWTSWLKTEKATKEATAVRDGETRETAERWGGQLIANESVSVFWYFSPDGRKDNSIHFHSA